VSDTTTPDRAQRLLRALIATSIRHDLARDQSPNYWRAVARSLRAEDSPPGPALEDALADAIDEAVARFSAGAVERGGGA